jgi:hypothetical protein
MQSETGFMRQTLKKPPRRGKWESHPALPRREMCEKSFGVARKEVTLPA